MPNDTTQQPQMQAPTGQQGNQEIDPEKMLIQMLEEMEQAIMDLSQRVDVLEKQEQGEMNP